MTRNARRERSVEMAGDGSISQLREPRDHRPLGALDRAGVIYVDPKCVTDVVNAHLALLGQKRDTGRERLVAFLCPNLIKRREEVGRAKKAPGVKGVVAFEVLADGLEPLATGTHLGDVVEIHQGVRSSDQVAVAGGLILPMTVR